MANTFDGLAGSARRRLCQLGDSRVSVLGGDGSQGWRARAPYDAIVVTASEPLVPRRRYWKR